MAAPFFIVSSGRSGTAMLHKALSSAPDVEMHHEYMVHIVQSLAVKRYLGLVDEEDARRILAETHGAATHYSTAAHWGDSSNKLSWLIPDLAALLPRARFVHLVRDGRKVASSYFHKLAGECYDDRSTTILRAHLDDPSRPAPPPEKKYWWPQPRLRSPDAARFRDFSQFERIVWHWVEVNRVILDSLGRLAPARHLFVRLEDLREDPGAVRRLYGFLGLDFREDAFAVFARPHNVNRPQDHLLTPEQRDRFEALAGVMQTRLGYAGQPEYVVKY